MATEQFDPNEWKTPRALLAFYWSVCVSLMLFYILWMWGSILAILTLVIGLIGGTILGGIFGVYFAGGLSKKPDNSAGPITGDNPQVTINSPNTPPTDSTPPAEVK